MLLPYGGIPLSKLYTACPSATYMYLRLYLQTYHNTQEHTPGPGARAASRSTRDCPTGFVRAPIVYEGPPMVLTGLPPT